MKQENWWLLPQQLIWTQSILNSYRHWTGQELIDRSGTPSDQSVRLFSAPFVVVSHDNQTDPILNYGNQKALDLWEMDWKDFRNTPSRLTAEPANQAERARMLHQAKEYGVITNYRGIRISGSGRRFLVERATVWNVLNDAFQPFGQAAMFTSWSFLPEN